MRVVSAAIMLLGLVIGAVVYNDLQNAATSVIHQVLACAEALMVIVGAYVLARALELVGEQMTGKAKTPVAAETGVEKQPESQWPGVQRKPKDDA